MLKFDLYQVDLLHLSESHLLTRRVARTVRAQRIHGDVVLCPDYLLCRCRKVFSVLFVRILCLVSIFVLVDLKISRFVRETQLPADWSFFLFLKQKGQAWGRGLKRKVACLTDWLSVWFFIAISLADKGTSIIFLFIFLIITFSLSYHYLIITNCSREITRVGMVIRP